MGHTGEEMIGKIFERMNDWRHLPSYQLERRADLFFSLYLPEVLSRKLNTEVKQDLIPEFPIRIGTINKIKEKNNQSKKVDYFALSADGKTAFLIELKTDNTSINEEQTETLLSACETKFDKLINGVLEIFKSGNLTSIRRRKYLYLLNKLGLMGQISVPEKLKDFIESGTLRGINVATEGLKTITQVTEIKPVYIVPSRSVISDKFDNKIEIITFADFQEVINNMNYNDMVSTQFKACLSDWAENEAGKPKNR